jgi:hypothetical protein
MPHEISFIENNLNDTPDNPIFSRPTSLCKQIVVLDGLTGTGKTMMSPLLSSFERLQNARFEYMFEYLCIAASNHKISEDAAISLINLLADSKCYDGMISREINFRPTDLSSVFNGSSAFKYLRQLFVADGENVSKRIEEENPALLLVTHQLLGCIQPAMTAFGSRLHVVEMVRHPLYLLDHWNSYISMHGNNPRDFTLWLNHNSHLVPWFAANWENKYIDSPQFDKVIYSITSLMKPVFEYFHREARGNVFTFIPFEQFALSPDSYLEKLEQTIGSSITQSTQRVLRAQGVPRKSINDGPQKSIYKRYALKKYDKKVSDEQNYQDLYTQAKRKSSELAFRELEKTIRSYEEAFGLWF